MLCRASWQRSTSVSEVDTSCLQVKTADVSETLVPINQTARHNIPEDHNLNTHQCENLNSHTHSTVPEINALNHKTEQCYEYSMSTCNSITNSSDICEAHNALYRTFTATTEAPVVCDQ